MPYLEITEDEEVPTVGHAPNIVLTGAGVGVVVVVVDSPAVILSRGRMPAGPSAAAKTSFFRAEVLSRRLSTFPGVTWDASRRMTSLTPDFSAFEVPTRVRLPLGLLSHVTLPSSHPLRVP